ncbi:hypothetical protein HK405_008797, partial [Cladochytrium tenue]
SIGIHWWHKRLEDGVALARESVLGRVLQRTCPATLATSGAAALELADDVAFSAPAQVHHQTRTASVCPQFRKHQPKEATRDRFWSFFDDFLSALREPTQCVEWGVVY